MNIPLEAGMIVRHPQAPEWGVGQVQSVDGSRVTVNFPEAGKRTLDGSVVALEVVGAPPEACDAD